MIVEEQLLDTGVESLLAMVAQQLRQPLMTISRSVELSHKDGVDRTDDIATLADASLRLIDSYIFAKLYKAQHDFVVEPVTIGSIMMDVAKYLQPLAELYDCDIDVDVRRSMRPILANSDSLELAFSCLATSFLQAVEPAHSKRRRIVLAAHPAQEGAVAGVFGTGEALDAQSFRTSKILIDQAQQPAVGLGANGAGVFVADTLLKGMNYDLYVARHAGLSGLGIRTIFAPQLKLWSE